MISLLATEIGIIVEVARQLSPVASRDNGSSSELPQVARSSRTGLIYSNTSIGRVGGHLLKVTRESHGDGHHPGGDQQEVPGPNPAPPTQTGACHRAHSLVHATSALAVPNS
jgi:hypothetical protein